VSLSNAAETEILELIFNAGAWADIAENDTSSPAANLYVSLHTADPGEAGAQNTSETAYTNYARVAVARNSGGWTVAGNAVTNAGAVAFPQCGATPGASLTHFGIGTSSSGAGQLIASGALAAPLAISTGVTPSFAAGDLDGTLD
jgi:hypothetical protein